MSLPSKLSVYDKFNQEIASGFINVGWVLPRTYLLTDDKKLDRGYTDVGGVAFPKAFCRAIQETIAGMKKHNDGKWFSHSDPDWFEKIDHVEAYDITITKERLNFIILRPVA